MTLMLTWQAAHQLALSLPQTQERDHFGGPSFRVWGKVFAQLSARDHDEQLGKVFAQLSARDHDEQRALVKLSAADQAALTRSDPETFSSVPRRGRHGWTYVQLATLEISMLRGLLLQSWRQLAPKKPVAACVARKK